MRLRRLAAVIGILVLAPIGAEYLVGYDTSTGNCSELAANLIVFAPLYGQGRSRRVGVGRAGWVRLRSDAPARLHPLLAFAPDIPGAIARKGRKQDLEG